MRRITINKKKEFKGENGNFVDEFFLEIVYFETKHELLFLRVIRNLIMLPFERDRDNDLWNKNDRDVLFDHR
jgi:hypothetical protein